MQLHKQQKVLNILREIKKDFYLVTLHKHNNENKMINVILSNIILIFHGGRTDQKEVYSLFVKVALLSKIISTVIKVLELAMIKCAYTLGYFIQYYSFSDSTKQTIKNLVSQCSEDHFQKQIQEGNQISENSFAQIADNNSMTKDLSQNFDQMGCVTI